MNSPSPDADQHDTPPKNVALLDPINLALCRDQKSNRDIFWEHKSRLLDQIQAELQAAPAPDGFVTGEEAQGVLEPRMELLLQRIRGCAAKQGALRWLVLIRATLSKFLGEFMNRSEGQGLTRDDRLGVLGMLEGAAREYGQKNGYFGRHGIPRRVVSGTLVDAVAAIPPVPDADIRELRDLLDLTVALYLHEKAYRVAGRGCAIRVADHGRLILRVPNSIRAGLDLYDRRAADQRDAGHILTAAGFSGSLWSLALSKDSLFGMGRPGPEHYCEAMDAVRSHDPGDFNPYNWFPHFLDGRAVFAFLRRMPEGLAQKTGGLTPEVLLPKSW